MLVPRRTLARPFRLQGVGVHTGAPSAVSASAAPFGAGITFVRDHTRIPATVAHVVGDAGRTVLGAGGVTVSTVEHLLAALAVAGVTDAELAVDGPEVPILDGSSAAWRDAIEVVDGPPCDALGAVHLRIEDGPAFAELRPSDRPRLVVSVDFGFSDAITVDLADLDLTAGTFVMAGDVARLRAEGRGKGASAANTVVVEGRSDVPARHKALDLAGDLALLGRPWRAEVVVHRGTHRLHHALVRAWSAA